MTTCRGHSQQSEMCAERRFRDVKDTVYPLLESDTMFFECLFVLCLFV